MVYTNKLITFSNIYFGTLFRGNFCAQQTVNFVYLPLTRDSKRDFCLVGKWMMFSRTKHSWFDWKCMHGVLWLHGVNKICLDYLRIRWRHQRCSVKYYSVLYRRRFEPTKISSSKAPVEAFGRDQCIVLRVRMLMQERWWRPWVQIKWFMIYQAKKATWKFQRNKKCDKLAIMVLQGECCLSERKD